MSFEYRELAAQVFFGAGDKSPCRGASCREETKDCGEKSKIADCVPCQTTECQVKTIPPDHDHGRHEHEKGEHRKALGLLREQLRDALAAG